MAASGDGGGSGGGGGGDGGPKVSQSQMAALLAKSERAQKESQVVSVSSCCGMKSFAFTQSLGIRAVEFDIAPHGTVKHRINFTPSCGSINDAIAAVEAWLNEPITHEYLDLLRLHDDDHEWDYDPEHHKVRGDFLHRVYIESIQIKDGVLSFFCGS